MEWTLVIEILNRRDRGMLAEEAEKTFWGYFAQLSDMQVFAVGAFFDIRWDIDNGN